jgi:hypothetical protein
MRRLGPAIVFLILLTAPARLAWADATAFLGATTTPSNRAGVGGALGFGLLIVGIEFEYSSAAEDTNTGAPSLKVGSGNGLLQTPVAIFGFQPYLTAGGGVFRERVGASAVTGFAPNVGGGVKIGLVGPLRLRVDYRRFSLGSGARYSPSHRFYAGLNVKF